MPETDPGLFGPDDPPASPPNRKLVVHATRGRPLTKEERAFNRALERVQTLSRALDDENRRLDQLLVFHAAEIRPRLELVGELRSGLVRALAPFLDDRRLTKGDRRVTRQIVIEQLDRVLSYVDQPDQDLQALFERLHHTSYAQALQDDLDEAREGMAAMFDELGLDVDMPELRADMTHEEMAAMTAQLADELQRAGESHSAKESARAKTKSERRAEERTRRFEELQKNSLSTMYRRLVKELHPDLELEPAERERKSAIMQEVTAAYARRDLHALLKLELQWLDPAGDVGRIAQEKLRAYVELLKQQAADLQDEIELLPLHPRYALLLVDGPFDMPMVIDGAHEVGQLDSEIVQLRSAIVRLSSDQALDEVRGAIRDYRQSEKRRAFTPRRRR
jgi:hypothetical protein